jgi:hypothetical protein
MAEMKIARFIGIEACKNVFSENSTFVLRSPQHYRRLYEPTAGGDEKGDPNEGIAEKSGGGTAEFTHFLASCWTKLKGSQPTPDEWKIFEENEQNIMAIVTTPKRVYDFLNEALEMKRESAQRRLPFLWLRRRKVHYGKRKINHKNILDDVPFTKHDQFKRQNEYRFVLGYAWPPVIDSLIFCAGVDYMEHLDGNRLGNFVNPRISPKNKGQLLSILQEACVGYGDFSDMPIPTIIANADDLLRDGQPR